MKTKKKSNKLWIFLAVVGAGTLAYGYGPGKWFEKKTEAELRGSPVRRGPLRISVVQRGNLAAKDSTSIESEIEGQTTVLFLIAEGTSVKPGDLLVELDASDLVEKKRQQEIAVQNADASYVKAKAQYEIQESQNKSDIEAAERKLYFAELDKKKYLEGDRPQLIDQAKDKILLAQSKRTQAENTKDWSDKLFEKGFVTKSDMDKDQLDFESSDVQLKQAVQAKELLEKYEDERRKVELNANVDEAGRGLERTKLRAEATIVDFEAGRNTSKARLELEEQRLAKWLDQIAKARIVSKVSGMVVYSRVESGRMGMGEPIQKGSQVRERQEILTIPRTGGMIAEASIHESVLKQVLPGLPCTLNVDAMPGQSFKGKVQFVALLPDKGSWWANPNQRLYKTEISLDEVNPEMRPGMSCNIEIMTQEIPDALFVPLQCILTQKGDTIAFVSGGDAIEERKVKVGRNNDKWVEVAEGLKEGEIVLLSPPPGFVPEGKEQGQPIGPPGERRGNGGGERGKRPGGMQGAPGAVPAAPSAAHTSAAGPASGDGASDHAIARDDTRDSNAKDGSTGEGGKSRAPGAGPGRKRGADGARDGSQAGSKDKVRDETAKDRPASERADGDKPSEKSGAATSDKASEKSAPAAGNNPTEKSGAAVGNKPSEESGTAVGDKSSEESGTAVGDKPSEKSGAAAAGDGHGNSHP